MGIKKVLVCDACGTEIKKGKDNFHLYKIKKGGKLIFKSDRYTNAAGSGDNDIISLDLCRECASNGLDTIIDQINGNYDDIFKGLYDLDFEFKYKGKTFKIKNRTFIQKGCAIQYEPPEGQFHDYDSLKQAIIDAKKWANKNE